ncbi:MAG: glutathione peroxidase [Saprospiraceae bacterium]
MDVNPYEIPISSIHGKPIDLKDFMGKKLLIVNVASVCGFTRQYEGLQNLYEQCGEQLQILGCPCNDFGGQEPGSPDEITEFCRVNYGVTFPLTEKININTNPHPLYKWLTNKALNGVGDFPVTWNFQKFLLDETGRLISCFGPGTEPLSEEILEKIGM